MISPTPEQENETVPKMRKDGDEQNITWHLRLRHGIGLLLAATSHRFDGLDTIGKVFFLFAVVVFVLESVVITYRFTTWRGTLAAALAHPTEGLFFPTVLITIANLIGCSQVYGTPSCGPWFHIAMRVTFWIFCAVGFIAAVVQYLSLFNAHPNRMTIQGMTPAWILPVFPIMIGGTLAQLIAPDQTPANRLPIIVAGVTFQGLGWMVAFLMYAAYIHRLMGYGLPAPNLRPGMFISVGPPSFTAVALIGLSNALPKNYGFFAANQYAVEALRAVALFTGIFLWVLAFWFFCITLLAILLGLRKM